MSIDVKCDVDGCKKPLDEPGALVFSPVMEGSCIKLHVCIECYDKLLREFFYQGSRRSGK